MKLLNGQDAEYVKENSAVKFKKISKEMRKNKHFKDFFLFHDNSMKTGLEKLD